MVGLFGLNIKALGHAGVITVSMPAHILNEFKIENGAQNFFVNLLVIFYYLCLGRVRDVQNAPALVMARFSLNIEG